MPRDHFMISESDGALYDTREAEWSKLPPLRSNYARHHRHIESAADFKATLRAGAYAWPGAYELFFIVNDGGALCFDCARTQARLVIDSIRHRTDDGWRVTLCEIAALHEDGVDCDHCGRTMHEAESC